MLGESQLNVYILGADLTARQRERIQAQIQTALRSLPGWVFQLVSQRIASLGVRNLPLIIEPQPPSEAPSQVISLGRIESRPAVRLLPCWKDERLDWGQDHRYLVAKAVAYMATPEISEESFWARWATAAEEDQLRETAQRVDDQWEDASDLGLLIEMAAACALTPDHNRWNDLPHVRSFLDEWRGAKRWMI